MLLAVLLLCLLSIPAIAQDREKASTFHPTVEQVELNSYTTIYRIQDGNVVCYWIDSFQKFGLSCVVNPKDCPPMDVYFPVTSQGATP